jgi:hypothetical protein
MTISEELGEGLVDTPFLTLPGSTVNATKTLVHDWLGVSAIGGTMPCSRVAPAAGRSSPRPGVRR